MSIDENPSKYQRTAEAEEAKIIPRTAKAWRFVPGANETSLNTLAGLKEGIGLTAA